MDRLGLSSIPLPLLNLLQRPHGAVQRVLVVPSEFGVGAFEGGVAECFWFFDPVSYISVFFTSRIDNFPLASLSFSACNC
jgi:hypothetical protein